jgi:hypothetical protein
VNIGKSIYSPANTIQKALFHPQSKHDNTIVILSSDSHLRVFELSLSPHIAEQDIPLFPSPKRGYTVDFDIPVPVSFTFGTGSEWTLWTIFILTRDGDIYVLCPIMPTKCVSTRTAVNRMKAIISYRGETARLDESCSKGEKETCLNQTRWISDILGQISMGDFMGVTASPAFTGVDTGDTVSFKRPNKVRPTPEIQGPVLFQPAPAPMDNVLCEANDIAYLDTEGLGVVVITWQGGRVDVGVLLATIEGVWHVKGMTGEELSEITVAAYESINLPALPNVWTGILTSVNDDEGVFVAAGDSVWQVDFRSWLHELQQIDQDDDDEEQTLFLSKRSRTTLVVSETYDNQDSANYSPDSISGYGLLFDPLLDYHLLTISTTFHAKFTELALPTLPTLSPNLSSSPSPTQSRRTTKPATYLAYPFPDDSPLTSPGKSIVKGLNLPTSVLREKDPLSTEAIQVLGDITVRIRNTVGDVLRVGEGLHRRYSSFKTNI